MARSKPTRKISLTYKAYEQSLSEGPLFPCFIGPRYALHNVKNGNTYIGDYEKGSGITVDNINYNNVVGYPGKSEELSVVDLSSVYVSIQDGLIRAGEGLELEGIKQGTTNCLIFKNAVAGANLDAKLNGYNVAIDDVLEIGEKSVVVTDVQPTVTAASAYMQDTTGATITNATIAGFKGTEEAIYMLTVSEIIAADSDKGIEAGVKVKVQSITGDPAYALGDNSLEVKANVEVSIGTKGIKVTFNELTSLTAGTILYVYGVPETLGDYVEVSINSADIEVSEGTTADIYTVNLSPSLLVVSKDKYTVNEGSVKFDDNITVMVGDKEYLIKTGKVHINYREQLLDNANILMKASATGIDTFVGEADPSNPLGFMYYCGTLAGSTEFFVISVAGTDADDYKAALDAAFKNEEVFAPITFDQSKEVLNYCIAKLAVYNDPSMAQFKKLWIAADMDKEQEVYSRIKDTGVSVLVKINDQGEVTFLNGDIISAGVRKGDILTLANKGKSYTVNTVKDTDTLTVKGFDIPGFEFPEVAVIKRILDNDQYVEIISNKAKAYNSPYINYVWADTPACGDFGKVSPVYLCATLASLRCVSAPHAPLSDVVVPGWNVGSSFNLSEYQLDILNDSGVWIVFNDTYNNTVTRHQLTTVQDGTIAEEDSAVSNACAIIRQLRSLLYEYRGNANVTNDLISQLSVDLVHALEEIRNKDYPYTIGPQLIGYVLNRIEMDPDNASRIIVDTNLDVPEPLLDGNFKFNII